MIFIKDWFINDGGEIIILVIIWKLLYLIKLVKGWQFHLNGFKDLWRQHGKDRNAALKRKQQQQRREVSIRLCSLK